MQKYFRCKNIFISFAFIFIVSTLTYANKYTLVIEPTFPSEQGKQVYEPLRQWLSKKTGHDLEVIIDNNYYFYWRNANGSRMPDFTLDAPHVAAFRSKNKNYRAIVTTIEPLSYHLITLDEPPQGTSIQDFMVSKKIVMLPSPSLASVFFNQWFTDLFAAPHKDVSALSWQEAVEIVFDGGAQAAIVPDWMFNLYPNFTSLIQSENIPGTTFMASPNIPKDVVENFQSALLSLQEDEAAYDVLVELNTEGFKKANPKEYEDLLKLLPGTY
ncbi:MAG: PhnD/SsuA/transferrin family substrate-binding protein [Alcanivoracaceae bacterium]|nr:PhnD/SsuA/transferrin family substrate-binding protein [Alcanivoracaceae bacterium]